MKLCVWSSTSFEQSYASYHLIEGLINAMLDAEHEVWLVQMKKSTGAMPESLQKREQLHVVNIPWVEPEKTNFVKRYLMSIKYYFVSMKEIDKLKGLDAIFNPITWQFSL